MDAGFLGDGSVVVVGSAADLRPQRAFLLPWGWARL